jgi:hypothetical protein
MQWRHHESLDGLADVAFWGRDAETVAYEMGAQRQVEGWGWTNLPVEEAERRARHVRRLPEERELRFAWDFRPHSHPHAMMEQIRQSEGKAGAGVLDLGAARLCMFETSWGDGAFPVIRDLDAEDNLIRIRVDLGHEKIVENMRRIAAR